MKSRLDAKQYELLVSSVKAADVAAWNRWYAAHLKETQHLRGTSVFGAHLDGADLSYLNLEGADLRFASLQGADLSYSYLKDANLEGANLFSANLWRAYLGGANMDGANPDSAHFEPAGKVKFDAVQLELLKMGSDVWNPWYAAKLCEENSNVRLYGAYLEEVSLA
ncbi:MAG TPA: pentapeptide repeat-containing protein, partial [Methanocorpusculum sp.]|nr:pentapeptide repeat-containing protein [Methanocorpusculum sp.]